MSSFNQPSHYDNTPNSLWYDALQEQFLCYLDMRKRYGKDDVNTQRIRLEMFAQARLIERILHSKITFNKKDKRVHHEKL